MTRPDLAFSPPSGSALPAGAPASVSWTAPWPGAWMTVIVGTSPGDLDVASLAVPDGQPIEFTFPAGARRAFVSCWLTGPSEGPLAYSLTFWRADDALTPETALRRLVAAYWLAEWLGEDLSEKRLCPARVLGWSGEEDSFSVDRPADVAPWTADEVRASAGYVLLRLRELERLDDGVTAGAAAGDGGGERVASGEYRLYALDFELAVPSKPAGRDSTSLLEARRAELERIFAGASLDADGTTLLSVRNLARYPSRRRGGADDGTFRRAYLTVQLRARVRIIHAGPQEVALP